MERLQRGDSDACSALFDDIGCPFEPWVFAIARNVAADHTRRGWSRATWEELVAQLPERLADASNAALRNLRYSSPGYRPISARPSRCRSWRV